MVLSGSPTNLLHLVVNSSTKRGLVVSNNWSVPYAFEVYGNGTVKVNGVAVHSDSTLKEDITTLDSQIDNIKKLRSVSYKWKVDKDTKINKRTYGLLAQELEKVYPDMVSTDDSTGLKSIFYTELIPVLLEVVQEQQEEIDAQAQQLLDIEKRLAQLENKSKN